MNILKFAGQEHFSITSNRNMKMKNYLLLRNQEHSDSIPSKYRCRCNKQRTSALSQAVESKSWQTTKQRSRTTHCDLASLLFDSQHSQKHRGISVFCSYEVQGSACVEVLTPHIKRCNRKLVALFCVLLS